jgi:serine phosphatase RsbU (regulator of sigma subunit)
LISTIIAIVVFARRVSTPILAAKRAADAWATGDLSARAADGAAPFHAETAALIDAFDGMAAAMRGTQLKTRVLYKSTTELFHCTDLDAVVRKAVELACTQCGADVAWFDPVGDKSDGTDERRQAGAWMWKQHRLHERTGKDMIGVWQRRDGDRVLSFSLKGQGKEIGILRAAFATAPDELGSTLIHSLAGLLDMAITKFDQGMRGAMLQTEVDMAEAVRRDLVEATREPERRGHVAFHYQPAQRFGGDWFHLIETDDGQVLYAVIGDVTGHGLVQGMITTAVKGALDAIEGLLKRGIESVASPSIIVSMLDGVVRRIASQHALAMTCVAVRIDFRTLEVRMCNAGHTFPILVRDEGGVSVAMHLHKEQQSMLGTEGVHTPYREAIYQLKPRDLLVLYTDGLTNARSFKSEVFGKFLFRSLKRRRDLGSAKSLRDEILAMFKYYTQNQRVDDDVCFLVTQIMPVERQVRDPRSSPAA